MGKVVRRQKQRTIVIPPRMRKRSRPKSGLARLSATSLPAPTPISTTRTRIEIMRGYAQKCDKRNTRQCVFEALKRRQQRPNSAATYRSPKERLFVHDQELATPGLKLAGQKKTLMANTVANGRDPHHQLR